MLSSHVAPYWFALQVKRRLEQATAHLLCSKGYEQFVPLYGTSHGPCATPLFPGYVFCRFDPAIRAPIVTTPGVIRVVGFGNTPARICDEEMDAIQRIVRSTLPMAPHLYLSVGETVRICDGPLSGIEGRVVSLQGRSSLVVSITLVQRSMAVRIDSSWIEPMAS